MKRWLLILCVICSIVSACSSRDNPGPLVGSWRLTAYGPVGSLAPAVPDVEANLSLGEDGTLTGSSGCNQLGGEYQVEGDKITVGPMVSTLIACPDLQMAQEDAIHKVLMETASFSIEGNRLTIIKNGVVLVFEAMASAA